MDLKELNEKIEALQGRAEQAIASVENVESPTAEAVAEVKALIHGSEETPGIQSQLNVLLGERDAALREEEFKSMRGQLTTLEDTIKQLRVAPGEFTGNVDASGNVEDDQDPYGKALRDERTGRPTLDFEAAEQSFYADIVAANRGVADARERVIDGFDPASLTVQGKAGKAMTEGTAAQGGYLVRPQVERTIVETRELDNVLRGLCSKLNVNTNSISLDQITLSTTAGWVAELAQKPETTGLALANITASVFTAAGLATISNQLLADSNPAVDGLVTADLAKRLVALEETAFINGSGVNQPLGILQTPGLGATPITVTDISADGGLLDKVLDAILAVQTDHGNPTGILLHPRTWTRILKDKDADGAYVLSPDLGVQGNRLGIQRTLWGVPVILSNRIPTNLGAGTNESRVIVGDFSECLILDRQGITVDESEHVHFTTNQTVFRAEQRVGFTAARTPLALNVIGGAGLAAG